MVHLVLSSLKGNQGLRYFPYTGYLGLTPVRVEGVVRTRLDADQRTLQATSLTISIRCYESRLGRVNILQSNVLVDHTQVLWSKSDTVDYEPVGNLEHPFRLTLPIKTAGFSTAVFVDYRCVWRVEAVLNHIHISGVGSRQVRHFELPLVRYDLPTQFQLPLPDPYLGQLLNKSRAPRIQYNIDVPTNAIGPTDLLPLPIHLQPFDSAVSIRSASVVVERRIQLLDTSNAMSTSMSPAPSASASSSPSQSPSPTPVEFPSPSSSSIFSHIQTAPHIDRLHANREGSGSTLSLSSSNPTITPHSVYPSSTSIASSTHPLLQPPTPPPPTPHSTATLQSKLIVNTIIEAETSGRFTRDENGVWHKTMTLQWPAAKSHSRWATGETIQSDLVSVRYFVRVKIVVQSPHGSDTLELNEKELLVVSTNNSERQLAITKYNEMLDSAHHECSSRSNSKSPRRKRTDREELPPSPLPSASISKTPPVHMPGSLHNSNGPKTRSVTRRPHTSAGPRDKPTSSGPRLETSSVGGRTRDDDGYLDVTARGELYKKRRSSRMEERSSGRLRTEDSQADGKPSSGKSSFLSSSAPEIGSVPSGSSISTLTSSSSSSHVESESDHMREWEEELARIEMKSRRSSDLLGFARFLRKRPSAAVSTPRVALPECNAS